MTKNPGPEKGKVFDIERYRATRKANGRNRETPPMSSNEHPGFDGQSTIFRGNLYAHIDESGQVDFDIVRAERKDAPALVMACLIMCMRLTRLIDAETQATP
jgi:hypothetical protein